MLGPPEILVILSVLGSLMLLAGLIVIGLVFVISRRSRGNQPQQPPVLK